MSGDTGKQDLLVHPATEGFRVLGQVDRQLFHASPRAADAIQWAIDACSGGGEVRLARGEYPLDRALRLAPDARLAGGGRGSQLLIDRDGDDAICVVGERIKGAEVVDLAIIDTAGRATAGVCLTSCGDCKVRDLYVQGFGHYGIWLREHTFLSEIRGCSVAGCREVGIRLSMLREGAFGDYVPNLVTNCIVYGGGRGIECEDAIVVNLVANCVYQASGPAFHIHSRSNSVLISGCRTFQITGVAVLVDGAHEFNCSSNIFCWHTEEGIIIRDAHWGAIVGNEVIDSGSYNHGEPNHTKPFAALEHMPPAYDAIRLENSKGYNVTGNTIFNWDVAPPIDVGVREDDRCTDNTIVANNVNYYGGDELVSRGHRSLAAHNLGRATPAHNPTKPNPAQVNCQSFERHLTDQFIQRGFEGESR